MSANEVQEDAISMCNQPLSECNDCGLMTAIMIAIIVSKTRKSIYILF